MNRKNGKRPEVVDLTVSSDEEYDPLERYLFSGAHDSIATTSTGLRAAAESVKPENPKIALAVSVANYFEGWNDYGQTIPMIDLTGDDDNWSSEGSDIGRPKPKKARKLNSSSESDDVPSFMEGYESDDTKVTRRKLKTREEQGAPKFHHSAVDYDPEFVIANDAVVREKIERYLTELWAGEERVPVKNMGGKPCRIVGCASLSHSSEGFCAVHYSMGRFAMHDFNGRVCNQPNCLNKARVKQHQCGFHYYQRGGKCQTATESQTPQEIEAGLENTVDVMGDMIKKDRRKMMYVGATQDPDWRFLQHSNTARTEGFDHAEVINWYANSEQLRIAEFQLLKKLSERVGNVHLKNILPGGVGYNPRNDRPGCVYILTYNQARGEEEPDPLPGRDFSRRHADFIYLDHYSEVTRPVLNLPKIKEDLKTSQALQMIGFNVRQSKQEERRSRNGTLKCPYPCPYSTDDAELLQGHITNEHVKKFKCKMCTYETGRIGLFRNHMQREHGIQWNPPKKEKRKEPYACGYPGCQESFATPQIAYDHRQRHKMHTCTVPGCGSVIQLKNCKRHYATHQMRPPVEPKEPQKETKFQCVECDRYFPSQHCLQKHLKTAKHAMNIKLKEAEKEEAKILARKTVSFKSSDADDAEEILDTEDEE